MDTKIIIFDFDGTLCDTRHTIVRTLIMTMEELGLPVATEEACTATIGLRLESGFKVLFPELSDEKIALCASTYRRIFDINKKKLVPTIFPNVPETLEELHDKGFVMTVASSRSHGSLDDFVATFGFDKFFSLVVGANDTAKGKPAPDQVLYTLRKTGFTAGEALVVGDMPFDILMGKGAGTRTCGVTYGNSCREELLSSGADFVIDDFSELTGLLK